MDPGQKIVRLNILPELMEKVVSKMNVNCFLPMCKTSSSMTPLMENCLKKYNYKNFTLGHVYSIKLTKDEAKIMHRINCVLDKADSLDFAILKYLRCHLVTIEDDGTMLKYLEAIEDAEPSFIDKLHISHCEASLIARALKILKPKITLIDSFDGDLLEILPVLPFSRWKKEGFGVVRHPFAVLFPDVAQYLNDFKIVRGGGRRFLLQAQSRRYRLCLESIGSITFRRETNSF